MLVTADLLLLQNKPVVFAAVLLKTSLFLSWILQNSIRLLPECCSFIMGRQQQCLAYVMTWFCQNSVTSK
jgi:hypothetical protein